MRTQIRNGVFETNSSSTHSVCIYGTDRTKFKKIPQNSVVVLDDSYDYEAVVYDELGKLNYVVTMLASILKERYPNFGFENKYSVNPTFEQMINLPWFKWLAEAVKEESNTTVLYKCPVGYTGTEKEYKTYYETTFTDTGETIEKIFNGGDKEVLSNEAKFKARVKAIIYTPTIFIEDMDNDY